MQKSLACWSSEENKVQNFIISINNKHLLALKTIISSKERELRMNYILIINLHEGLNIEPNENQL